MTAKTQKLFFNNIPLRNDIVGNLQGSVLFAQSTILPSRATMLAGDIQPHLVSLRKTLVMFRPAFNLNDPNNIVLNVLDKNNNSVYSTTLLTPDHFPGLAEQKNVSISDFIEPEQYDYIIDTQDELNKMKGDEEGKYLTSLLTSFNTIKIVTADNNGLEDIYFPASVYNQNGKLITFLQSGNDATIIHYFNKTVRSGRGNHLYFKNINGSWAMPSDLPDEQARDVFADPKKYDYRIDTQDKINEIANDPKGTYLNNLYFTHKSVYVELADGQWNKDFYLPQSEALPEGKKFILKSFAGYSANVYTPDHRIFTIHRDQLFVFIYTDGSWCEWQDTEYAAIGYAANLWSGIIPWQYMTPDVTFQFQADGLSGVYENPAIGAPSELLLHTIDLGLLTPERGKYPFQVNAEYHRQYFQTIPIARLIVNQYESVWWQEIMLADGTLYKDHSKDIGGVYDGDLRQQIAKELVSLGINNANYGINSSPGTGEDDLNKLFATAQLTAHNVVGNYVNGRVVHGMSGGGSIVTLDDSVGNEFSHELGHNYGLGHYPNGFSGSVHRSAEKINSTWGWESDKNLFIPNIEKEQRGQASCYDNQCQAPFKRHSFGFDAMAGGQPMYSRVNNYTLHTPYSLSQIQTFFESKIAFNKNSSTGYTKWNEATKTMEEYAEVYSAGADEADLSSTTMLISRYKVVSFYQNNDHFVENIFIPAADAQNKAKGIHIVQGADQPLRLNINDQSLQIPSGAVIRFESNGSQWQQVIDFSFNVVRKPQLWGVPVTTIVGYYDPQKRLPGYIYPALHAAYGYCYPSDSKHEIEAARNVIEVKNDRNETLRFVLRATRLNKQTMNRFHLNVPSSFAPSQVTLYHDGQPVLVKAIQPPAGTTHFTVNGCQ